MAFGGKLGDFGGWRAGAAKGRGPFDENRGKARPGTLFASALGLQTLLLCGAYEAAPLHAPVLRRGAGFLCAPEWALWRKAHSGGRSCPREEKKRKQWRNLVKLLKKYSSSRRSCTLCPFTIRPKNARIYKVGMCDMLEHNIQQNLSRRNNTLWLDL